MKSLPAVIFLILMPLIISGKTDDSLDENIYQQRWYADSIADLGFRLYQGDSVLGRDTVRGLTLIEEAAELDQPQALNNLAYLLIHGDTTMRDPLRAVELFRRAADKGLPTALAQLGDIYREGVIVPADTAKAEDLYLKAASKGLPDAQAKLTALLMPRWRELCHDSLLAEAKRLYPAPAPFAAVQSLLIILKDFDTSEYNPIAEDVPVQATALALLGDAYARGLGLQYDYEKSLKAFFQAAMMGDPSAQFIIAETLDISPDALDILGLTPLDPDTDPQRWYILAARKGITDAAQAYRRLLNR
ncbi:MAG: sel1 repeat family protein [Prevotella sp.]|nr:sel1 repeat family protein [Bacteroides sp.]MCM1366560.1 sel1 repeat family protein [Prevotella sp.]MCM1436870.1 sel1 repeat family protein [Prevotella sp.]